LRSLLERRSLQRLVREALEGGAGLYRRQWPLDATPTIGAQAEVVADWCRETLAGSGRPYGIDYVTLRLALVDGGGREVASGQLGALRPLDFYGQCRAETKMADLLRSWEQAGLLAGHTDRKLDAVLFSWGDLTRALLAAG
jgi:hypothetical protein